MITHRLKSGKTLNSIKGHLITREKNPKLYELLERGEEYGIRRNERSVEVKRTASAEEE